MKKVFLIIFAILFLAGCSSGKNNTDNKVVAQINKYKMTVDDIKYEFKNAPYDEIMSLKTENGRKKYIGGLIEKEILLQEAQRQGIDKEKDFMKASDFGLNIAAGVSLKGWGRIGLQYGLGLSNLALITDDDSSIKNRSFSLFWSYPFNLGTKKK